MCLPQESARDALVCRGNPLRSGLLRLDVGRADHLTPLFGFVGKQPPVIGGRAADRVAAQLASRSFNVGSAKAALISLFNLPMIWGGVFAGALMPIQAAAS